MKCLTKSAILILLPIFLFLSCKKSSTNPVLTTFIKLDTNGKAINYNSCFTSELIAYGQPQTKIVSQGGSGSFSITLNQAPNNLKTGLVYAAQTIKSLPSDSYSTFNFVPGNLVDDVYGYSSSMYNPIGSVTLTEVTSNSIKGTFSAGVFQDAYGTDLVYSITNGTFCSGSSAYTVGIQGN